MNTDNKQQHSIDYYTRLTLEAISNLEDKDGSAFSLDINTERSEVSVSFEEDSSMLIMIGAGTNDEYVLWLAAGLPWAVEEMVYEYFKVMNGDYL